jgi:hypothetical protein
VTSPCLFRCMCRAVYGWPIGKCSHFYVHCYHFLGVITGCEIGWFCVLVLCYIMPSLLNGVLVFPTRFWRGIYTVHVVDRRGNFHLVLRCTLESLPFCCHFCYARWGIF